MVGLNSGLSVRVAEVRGEVLPHVRLVSSTLNAFEIWREILCQCSFQFWWPVVRHQFRLPAYERVFIIGNFRFLTDPPLKLVVEVCTLRHVLHFLHAEILVQVKTAGTQVFLSCNYRSTRCHTSFDWERLLFFKQNQVGVVGLFCESLEMERVVDLMLSL